MTEVLLARLDHRLAGANWQRGGGKGAKPKSIEIPGVGAKPAKSRAERGEEAAQRLRNLGLISATPGRRPGPLPGPTPPGRPPPAAEFQRALEDELLAREMRLANES
ncbi:hypothetical protein [Plantactinospora sp. WMMB782]|uniref:hypothetical protein n=1 Tax=Plantactinospora sp. WMMB782 TaxID=3404121 RepID=UPI003B949017